MKEKFLRELADIQTGPFGSQLHKEDYVADGTPIVTVEHLGNKMFSEQNLPRVSNTDKNRLKKYVLKQGDIVFSRVGSVDRCSYVDQKHDGWMFSGRCLRVRPTSEIDSEYLYYYFCLEETKQFVRNLAVGATMPSIMGKHGSTKTHCFTTLFLDCMQLRTSLICWLPLEQSTQTPR